MKIQDNTKNIAGILQDIKALENNDLRCNKAVLFIAFPLSLKLNGDHWQSHINKIETLLCQIRHVQIEFQNGLPGVLYFGLASRA